MPITPYRVAFLALTVVAALGAWKASEERLSAIARQPVLPTRFDHANHRKVVCTTCHHNFRDRSLGPGGCFRCHKVWGTTEARRIDTVFHAFCTGCHRERKAAGEDAGPVKSCVACHLQRR